MFEKNKTTLKLATTGIGLFFLFISCFTVGKSVSKSISLEPAAAEVAENLGKVYSAVAAHVRPSVVSVYSERLITLRRDAFPFIFDEDFFERFFAPLYPEKRLKNKPKSPREYKIPQMGMGSGMLLDDKGHILTNYHVIADVDQIKVQFSDQKNFKAKVVGTDPKTDVAIIKILGDLPANTPSVSFGNSDTVQVGDNVLAIGAPFGLTQTVTHGIISAKGRADVGLADYENFLQTDASINPGNSGGPLVNMKGEVIGMNSAIATNVGQFGGVAFSIPSNMIQLMIPKLIKGVAITRSELGVAIQDLTESLAKHFSLEKAHGVLVSQVLSDSPAERAGIEIGDIIVNYDGQAVADSRSFRNMVSSTKPESKVKIELLRKKKRLVVTASPRLQKPEASVEKPEKSSDSDVLERLGLSAETITQRLAEEYNLSEKSGVIVSDVIAGGPAYFAGLRAGDIILQVNNRKVKNIENLLSAIAREKNDTILFLVKRDGSSLFVIIEAG